MTKNKPTSFQLTVEPVDDVSCVMVLGVFSCTYNDGGMPEAAIELLFVNHVYYN